MVDKKRISDLMKLEHGKMISMLKEIKSTRDKDLFYEFKKFIENHVYAEERAIFVFYKSNKKFKVLIEIMQQHTQINDSLNEFTKNLNVNIKENSKIDSLIGLIKNHLVLEDKEFYPHLDKDLTAAEQEDMFKKVKVILGNLEQKD